MADGSAICVVVSRVPKLVRPALAVPFTLTASADLGDAAPAGDFELAALLAASFWSSSCARPPGPVVVIGIDGLEWDVALRLIT